MTVVDATGSTRRPDGRSGTATVLVVDDAPEQRVLLSAVLGRAGFVVAEAADGEAAIEATQRLRPDVVVLDLGLPRIDGLEVCRVIRRTSDTYILMLTARDGEADRVAGLRSGADDYVTKPFSTSELVARIEALLRRPRSVRREVEGVLTHGDLAIHVDSREVSVESRHLTLTRIEFDILATLVGRPSMVFSRDLLIAAVWGDAWVGDRHVVDVHVANLRKKIDDPGEPSRIRTVRGVGYTMR